MPRQFDVCRLDDGTLVVVVQNDILEVFALRVVVPLFQPGRFGPAMKWLNPQIVIDGQAYVLYPQFIASLSLSELREVVANVASSRDVITRALDTLLSGV